jgi:hypothetical protein
LSATLDTIRLRVKAGCVRVSNHGVQELSDDGISLPSVIAGVEMALVVEDYPDHPRGACVLCLQRDEADQPIHVLWGLAARTPEVATIITGYRPDPNRWMDDLMTRKPR